MRVAETVPGGPFPMSDGAPSDGSNEARELQDLREFFYQCPVGPFEIDDDGLVTQARGRRRERRPG
jgi:hypothetical protein